MLKLHPNTSFRKKLKVPDVISNKNSEEQEAFESQFQDLCTNLNTAENSSNAEAAPKLGTRK